MSEVSGSAPSSPAPTSSSSGGAPSSPAPKASSGQGATSAPSGASSAQPQSQASKPSIGDQVKPKGPPQETAAEKARRVAKIKVDGKESEVDFDKLPLDELTYRYQMSEAADKRMREAAELRKKFGDIVSYGKENLVDAVKQLWGVDLDEWGENRIASRFEEAQLPEHEKKLRDLETKLKKFETQEQSRAELEKQAAQERHQEQVRVETERTFIDSLNKIGYDKGVASSLLPMMVDLAQAALSRGHDIDSDALAFETKKRLGVIAKSALKGLSGSALLEFLGDDVAKAVSKARLEKLQLAPKAAPIPAPDPAKAQNDKQRTPTMSRAQWRKKNLFGI